MKWVEIVLDILAMVLLAGGASVGVPWLINLIASTKWAKRLKIAEFIRGAADDIVRVVEQWAARRVISKDEKLARAMEELKKAVSRYGVKITAEEAEREIEAALNRLKATGGLKEHKS